MITPRARVRQKFGGALLKLVLLLQFVFGSISMPVLLFNKNSFNDCSNSKLKMAL